MLTESGLLSYMLKNRILFLVVEQTITYSRPIVPFQKYVVSTTVEVSDDDKWMYYKHSFNAPSALNSDVPPVHHALITLKAVLKETGGRTVKPSDAFTSSDYHKAISQGHLNKMIKIWPGINQWFQMDWCYCTHITLNSEVWSSQSTIDSITVTTNIRRSFNLIEISILYSLASNAVYSIWLTDEEACYDMIWYDMIWYDMIWYDMIWYDMIWYDLIWYDMRGLWYHSPSRVK